MLSDPMCYSSTLCPFVGISEFRSTGCYKGAQKPGLQREHKNRGTGLLEGARGPEPSKSGAKAMGFLNSGLLEFCIKKCKLS